MKLTHADGSEEVISLKHTMNMEHISWFEAGSALNLIRLDSGDAAIKEGMHEAPPEEVPG